MTDDGRRLQLGSCKVDLRTGRIHGGLGGGLSDRELEVLQYLANRPNLDVSRDEIIEAVWRESGTLTRALDTTVRRLRMKIESKPESPEHVITVYGYGYRFVPCTTPRAAVTGNLRPAETVFVGRENAMNSLDTAFGAGGRLITLVGPPGIGKTRFAHQYGIKHTKHHSGGTWEVPLANARNEAQIPSAVAAALGLPLAGHLAVDALVAAVGQALGGRGLCLIILDNFEQVRRYAVGTVQRWMQDADQARFLVTSREPLGLPNELVVPIEPLPSEEAVALFVERAAIVRPSYAPNAPERRILAEICESLDRLPLAVELAAARMGVLSATQLQQRLYARFRILGRAQRHGTGRQATLRAAIDWSWDLLDPPEQRALAQCSVFVDGFDLEAAKAVLEGPAEDLVRSLCTRSLVRRYSASTGASRFGLLQSIRAYADEKVADRDAVAMRHALHYVSCGEALAESVNAHGGVARLDQLAGELSNLFAAHSATLTTAPALAGRAACAASTVLSRRGPQERLMEVFDASIRVVEDPLVRARLLGGRAVVFRERGENAASERDSHEAIACAEAAADARCQAGLLGDLGNLYREAGRIAEAEETIRDSLARYEELGNQRGQGVAHCDLGVVCMQLGRIAESEAHYRAAREFLTACGDTVSLAVILSNLAVRRADVGAFDEARELLEEALAINRAVGNRRPEGATLGNLGQLALMLGDLDAAERHLTAAITICAEVGIRHLESQFRASIGIVWLQRGKLDRAERELRRAMDMLGDPSHRVHAALTADLGAVRWRRGDLAGALEHFNEALAAHDRAGDRRMYAYHLCYRAGLEAALGEPERAETTLLEARACSAELDHATGADLADIFEGCIAVATGDLDRAKAIHAASVREDKPAVRRALALLARTISSYLG